MNPSHLLDQARRLATEGPGRPRQDDLRRAVSAAYYAVFHLLVDAACGRIVGKTRRGRTLRDALSRAFAHGEMASVCDRFAGGSVPPPLMPAVPRGVPARLKLVAETFVMLQQQRHAADYNRAITFDRQRVSALIREAEDAVAAWAAVANERFCPARCRRLPRRPARRAAPATMTPPLERPPPPLMLCRPSRSPRP